jgi:hypothetical protein
MHVCVHLAGFEPLSQCLRGQVGYTYTTYREEKLLRENSVGEILYIAI